MEKERVKNLIADLEKALKRLEEALDLTPSEIHQDATIQRFEFSFELSWKLMQAVLRSQGIVCVSPKGCIRDSVRLDLIDNPEVWFGFLEARNLVSHTYNEKQAKAVYGVAKKFLPQALIFLQNCRSSREK
ncbi:MAG: nucleotidyltransferase substrate binding protein [Patescibacteria group bacterium]